MPRKKKEVLDSKLQEKLDYIGLDLTKLPKKLKEYTDINFRTIKGYDEKKYKQYRFVSVSDIEILVSPTTRMDSIKDKYEKAMPLCYYLDSKNEENIIYYTEFLKMLNKVQIAQIEEIEDEQRKLIKSVPLKVKFHSSYLWQVYYSEISDKFFMIVTTEDSDYSTLFYLLKKKIEDKKQEKIFVPISLIDYEGEILKKDKIRDLENYLWLFTKEYPSIYEVGNKRNEISLNIIGETELYEKIKTMYALKFTNSKEATMFYKLAKALFILQTELPKYYNFKTNINKNGEINFYFDNVNIMYETLPEFVMEQYLKSVSLKNKAQNDIEEFTEKLEKLKTEAVMLEREYMAKEKQITTFLECKKTFFGKVKYFFKFGKKSSDKNERIELEKEDLKSKRRNKKQPKFRAEAKDYTLYELEQSYKELEAQEEKAKNIVMDINALKLKNKNMKKKIENASNYIDEINKHKRSIFEFWKYSNKDAVASLDEGEEEEFNVTKVEKVFSYDEDFEDFGIYSDKIQRKKLTDAEMESAFVASSDDILKLINRMDRGIAENKEISEILKNLKISKEKKIYEGEDDDEFNVFGKLKQANNKERTIGSKVHREQPRDKYEILEIKKGCRGIELKRSLENVMENLKSALKKNSLREDLYVYKADIEEIKFDSIMSVSLNAKMEMEKCIKENPIRKKFYLYKIKIPKDTNYVALSNIIFYDNTNMTLPVGMNLSSNLLLDLSDFEFENQNEESLNKLQYEEEGNEFSKVIVKNIEIKEFNN